MKFEIQNIRIENIDKGNFSFNITTNSSTKNIENSISSIGLLSYPYLIFKKNKYVIISGFRRIISYDNLKYITIPAKVVSSKTSHFECVKLAIADNAFQRELNIVEISRCYRILMDSLEDNINLVDDLKNSLGFMISKSAMEKIKPISSLSWFVQKGLIEGFISLPTALKIGKMKLEETSLFVKLFKILNTTLSNQREIMDLMLEISFRDNISIEHIFSSEPMENILFSHASCFQKTSSIRSYLRKLRYPTITSASDKFEENLKQLNLNKNIKLTPPKFFEGQTYNLSINFKKCIELEKYKKDINKIIHSPNILSSI